ncbi:glycosyltransferase [Nocardioides sp. C4-1]|uniref:glycosyltransferase n=1 Tax=Nocardioides sp. C4-1 TaxID=3151851 RepID=UPI0032673071
MSRTVVVHERFTELGGSERVVEQLVTAFPGAEVFVPVGDDRGRPEGVPASSVRTSGLQRLYRNDGRYAHLLPLLPMAMARADLSDADLVLTSHHAFAQRVRVPDGVPMVSYVHTPARWMWEAGTRAGEPGGRIGEVGLTAFASTQRAADRRAAARPDRLVANSTAVAQRIEDWWGREALVVPPPVRTHLFGVDEGVERDDFYLIAGRLVPYKRPEVAVSAARRAGVRLIVVGEGRAMAACRAHAGPGIEFAGRVDDATMLDLMRRARGLLFTGVEDFGIVPVEAMACGTPVIALGEGGALDYVRDGETGLLVHPHGATHHQHADAFADALRRMDAVSFDPHAIRRHSEYFSEENFRARMTSVVAGVR